MSGGIRNLWIGIADHPGMNGIFEAEAINRGTAPTVRLRFQSPAGKWIGVPDTDPTTPIDIPEQTRLYVDAAGGLAPHTITITIGCTSTTSDRVDIETLDSGTLAIAINVADALGNETDRSISVIRRDMSESGIIPPTGAPKIRIWPTSPGPSRIIIEEPASATMATVRLSPAGGTVKWSWDGGDSSIGEAAQIPVEEDAIVSVTATRALAEQINCFTLFNNSPSITNAQLQAWADNSTNTHKQRAVDREGWTSGEAFQSDNSLARFDENPTGITWTVEGYSSYENIKPIKIWNNNG